MGAVARPVLREKPALVIFFVLFLYVTTFGLLNVVTGVIVDQTLQSSKEDAGGVQAFEEKQREERIPLLEELFDNVGKDGSGHVNSEEFMAKCQEENAQSSFLKFGLQVQPRQAARRLFEALDYNADGKITKKELVTRTQHLLIDGYSPMSDQTLVLIELRHLAQRLANLEHHLNNTSNGNAGDDISIAQAIINAEKRMTQRIATMESSVDRRMRRIETSILTETTL